MRFSSHARSPAPNYLGRREQRRLLTTIFLLGLVLFLMREAGRPGNWAWFVALNNPPQQTETPSAGAIDTRLQPAAEGAGVPGAVVIPAVRPAREIEAGEFFPGVKPELLETVRDDTVFRGAEHDAYFHLLEILHETDAKTLETASQGAAAFVQLYQQPAEYRGKLVRVSGTVRGVFKVPAARNDYGIVNYYQVWIQPYDNPNFPLVAYVLELPPGFPVAERTEADVDLTGFFFKRWAYRAQDAIRSAPLLLAKTVDWSPPKAVPETTPAGMAYVVGIVACALLAAGVVVWMAMRGGPAAYRGPLPPRRNSSEEGPDASPAESLRRLAEMVEASATPGPAPQPDNGADGMRPLP